MQAVKRHEERFPADFMFQLSRVEFDHLRSQSVTSSRWGGRRYPPYGFTEQGVAMLSSVLNSPRAIQVNIEIIRAFIRLRRMMASHANWRASWRTWRRSMMSNLRWSLTLSVNLWPRRSRNVSGLGFRPEESD